MKYKREGDRITLEMDRQEYTELLLFLGGQLSALGSGPMFWGAVEFVNALNAENPDYDPYVVPKAQRGSRQLIVERAVKILNAVPSDLEADSQ
jgi:hypothetical protein